MKKILKKIAVLAGVCAALIATQTNAVTQPVGDVLPSQTASKLPPQMQLPSQSVIQKPGSYGGPTEISASEQQDNQKVFGQQIFEGGFGGFRADDLNPNYKIAPGDQVVLRVWGAVNIDQIMSVDAQGNIFIPSIGPVAVSEVTHAQLDSRVRGAVKNIYPENVEVYTQLQGVQPVGVYVTGFVNQPGRYAGTPNDSVLYFLNQAKGIDLQNGSYRKVTLLRDNKDILSFDLYDFIEMGYLPKVQFEDGDTIVVERRGPVVSVVSEESASTVYEMKSKGFDGQKLIDYHPVHASITHVLIKGARLGKPFANYLALDDFKEFSMKKDDQVMFSADKKAETITIQVEGTFLSKSHFIVPKHATLQQVLNNIAIDLDLTNSRAVSIRRLSVAQKQKESLDASLRRLENTYLTATSETAEEAGIRIKEAELIQDFVQRAQQIKPDGRMVLVTSTGGVQNIRLQDGDVITLPQQSDAVHVSGQVVMPRSMVHQPWMNLIDYIDQTGGFNSQADPEQIVVIRQSGQVVADANARIQPGDEIIVLPKVPSKNIQLATSITQILYQIAIAAKVAFDL